MKKIILFLILVNNYFYSQNHYGSYKSESGSVLEINSINDFFYVKKLVYKKIPVIETFSISEGNFIVSNNLLYLNSNFDIAKKIDNNIEIIRNNESNNDYIEINFDNLPNDYDIFICNVHTLEFDSNLGILVENNDNCMKLSKTNKIKKTSILKNKIYFKIYPNYDFSINRSFNFKRQFLITKEFEVSKSYNLNIIFKELNIDSFYYEEFIDEIAIIKEDYIFFKGEKFYKKE